MTDPHDGTPGLPPPAAEAVAPEAPLAPEASTVLAPVGAAAPEAMAFPDPGPPSTDLPPTLATGVAPAPATSPPPAPRPTFLFFGAVAAVSLIADVSTKAWAEITLSSRSPLLPSIELVKEHLAFTLAYNP